MERKDSKVGQAGARLLYSLKRAQWLPHYDRATLRDVVAEMGELFKHLHHNLDMNRNEADVGQASQARTATITFLDTALRRNRQCVLAYLNNRQERIRELAWQHVGRTGELPEPIKERLEQDEIKFSRQYNAVLDQYMADLEQSVPGGTEEFGLDVTTDSLPPKGDKIEIQLLEPLQDRAIGARFLARRQLVEPLVVSGKAKHLNDQLRY